MNKLINTLFVAFFFTCLLAGLSACGDASSTDESATATGGQSGTGGSEANGGGEGGSDEDMVPAIEMPDGTWTCPDGMELADTKADAPRMCTSQGTTLPPDSTVDPPMPDADFPPTPDAGPVVDHCAKIRFIEGEWWKNGVDPPCSIVVTMHTVLYNEEYTCEVRNDDGQVPGGGRCTVFSVQVPFYGEDFPLAAERVDGTDPTLDYQNENLIFQATNVRGEQVGNQPYHR